MNKTGKLDETRITEERAKCSKCDGQMKEASFEILNSISLDFGHALLLGPKKAFYLNPQRRSSILVTVCTKCGYIECYAEAPDGL